MSITNFNSEDERRIEVDNHPAKVNQGIDQQLDKAIEVIRDMMKKNTKNQYPNKIPDFDDRSKKAIKK